MAVSIGFGGARASADPSVIKSVDSHAMPWQYVSGGLNTAYQFGPDDGGGPTVVSAADGLDFTTGGTFAVTYLDGLTTPYVNDIPFADAGGDPNYDASNNPGSSGLYFPSHYISSTAYPVYLNELVGVFTDSTGTIVGSPLALGNGPTNIVAPTGATHTTAWR